MNFQVQNTGAYKIHGELSPNLVDEYGFTVDIQADQIIISAKEDNIQNSKIQLTIDAPIKYMDFTGGLELRINGENLPLEEMHVSGAYAIDIQNLDLPKLTMKMQGANALTATGQISSMDLDMKGASTLDAQGLRIKQMTYLSEGASEAILSVEEHLDVTIRGAGEVKYYGNPTIVSDLTPHVSVLEQISIEIPE